MAYADETPAVREPNNIDEIAPVKSEDSKSLLVNGEVTFVTNDILRGVSISDGKSVTQGWIGLSYMQFLNAGIYTSETHFLVPSDPTGQTVANRYNLYFASVYLPVSSDFTIGLQFYHYDFLQYAEINQQEYFVELMYKNFKLSHMYNPNYIQLETKYQYISAEYKFEINDKDSITPLVSTTLVEKPENVDVRPYQEVRVTYTRNFDLFKVNAILSGTNRKHYYTNSRFKDNAIAFGVTVPF